MASATPGWPGLRLVKTCTECKQAKLKCDSKAKYPNPCSRCQSRQLRCTVDPMFKRTPARKRLEAMSKELREIKERRGAEGSTRPVPSSTEPSPSRNNSHTPNPSSTETLEDAFIFEMEEVQFEDVVLNRNMAINTFRIFATYYHPQLPILGRISMTDIYQSCPLLFWAIIAIVSLRMSEPAYQDLFRRLKQPYTDFLGREALQAPLPLQKLQAVLCVCHWTLGVKHQRLDPSWLYCGIAMNAAFYMGLNRPKPPPALRSIGVAPGNMEIRTNTWLGCFYVCNSLAMHLGLSPLISQPSDLRMTKSLFSGFRGPREFLAEVKVQQLISSFSSMLWPNTNDLDVDVSLVRTIDEKLDEISDEQAGVSSDSTVFTILTAKLHMYAAIVTRAPVDSTSRSIILKMGLGAALRIIDLAQTITPKPATTAAVVFAAAEDGENSDHNLLSHFQMTPEDRQRALSKKHFLAIVFATVFLLRYFSLNSAVPADEQQRAANRVLAAHGLFRSWSLEPSDEYARAAVLFETLARQAPHRADTQKLRLTDRMGVSILFDAVSTAHELRGEASSVVVDGRVTTPPPASGGGGGGDGDAASNGIAINNDSRRVPTRAEKGKQAAVEEAANDFETAVSIEAGVPTVYVDGMDVAALGGQGYEMGLPSDFWNNPMWDVFNFDFEAAASGQYLGDPFQQ
ncbi:hypothetical protein PG993_007438 [Apiospora rasikravindrae]|uniref:Zn(2)-C6 fungal-type domain-containing protein n=1 Tax=Apiospora rasikravindrae TaxID=990691 RepID=A0ABR1SXI5_9PEZI